MDAQDKHKDNAKACTECLKTKGVDDFWVSKRGRLGRQSKCKDCMREKAKVYCQKPEVRARRLAQYRRPEYKKKKADYWKEYSKTDSGREMVSAKRKRYRDRNPQKERARSAVRWAIESGRLERGSCEACGEANAHGHHDDYSKPLEVRWLCRRHHMEHHAAESAARSESEL